MVTPKGHGREITMFNPCTGISLSGSALERHSIVSRNVNLHRCQAQDIISNGNSEWAKLLMQVTHIYIYISRCVRSTQSYVKWIHLYLSEEISIIWRDCIFLRPVISQIAHFPVQNRELFFYITHACVILNMIQFNTQFNTRVNIRRGREMA